MLTEGKVLPLAAVISGPNTRDIKLLEETLASIVLFRPLTSLGNAQNLCLDAGYVGSENAVEQRDYIPHIRPRGEEKMALEGQPDFKAHCWVVEVCHSWLNRFSKLWVRFEKKADNYLALVQFARALIAWPKIIPFINHDYFTDKLLIYSAIIQNPKHSGHVLLKTVMTNN